MDLDEANGITQDYSRVLASRKVVLANPTKNVFDAKDNATRLRFLINGPNPYENALKHFAMFHGLNIDIPDNLVAKGLGGPIDELPIIDEALLPRYASRVYINHMYATLANLMRKSILTATSNKNRMSIRFKAIEIIRTLAALFVMDENLDSYTAIYRDTKPNTLVNVGYDQKCISRFTTQMRRAFVPLENKAESIRHQINGFKNSYATHRRMSIRKDTDLDFRLDVDEADKIVSDYGAFVDFQAALYSQESAIDRVIMRDADLWDRMLHIKFKLGDKLDTMLENFTAAHDDDINSVLRYENIAPDIAPMKILEPAMRAQKFVTNATWFKCARMYQIMSKTAIQLVTVLDNPYTTQDIKQAAEDILHKLLVTIASDDTLKAVANRYRDTVPDEDGSIDVGYDFWKVHDAIIVMNDLVRWDATYTQEMLANLAILSDMFAGFLSPSNDFTELARVQTFGRETEDEMSETDAPDTPEPVEEPPVMAEYELTDEERETLDGAVESSEDVEDVANKTEVSNATDDIPEIGLEHIAESDEVED